MLSQAECVTTVVPEPEALAGGNGGLHLLQSLT